MNSSVHKVIGRRRNRLGSFGMTAVIGLSGLGGLVQQCAPAPAPAPAIVQVGGVETTAVTTANQHRANSGTSALVVDSRLTSAAQRHANDMANRQVMTHTGSDRSNGGQRIALYGYGAVTWAENVAAGQTTPEQVVAAWMNSAGHRKNILNGSLVNIGVAAATGTNGVTYWAMVLAA
jgi:uncharacterized protein YkwD